MRSRRRRAFVVAAEPLRAVLRSADAGPPLHLARPPVAPSRPPRRRIRPRAPRRRPPLHLLPLRRGPFSIPIPIPNLRASPPHPRRPNARLRQGRTVLGWDAAGLPLSARIRRRIPQLAPSLGGEIFSSSLFFPSLGGETL